VKRTFTFELSNMLGTPMEKGADIIQRPSPRRSESTLEL
jgi:hypothetical protein